MDEFVRAERDGDMGDATTGGPEEHEIARCHGTSSNRLASPKLIADLARQQHLVLREDILGEPAAVEAIGAGAPVVVSNTSQGKRGLH